MILTRIDDGHSKARNISKKQKNKQNIMETHSKVKVLNLL